MTPLLTRRTVTGGHLKVAPHYMQSEQFHRSNPAKHRCHSGRRLVRGFFQYLPSFLHALYFTVIFMRFIFNAKSVLFEKKFNSRCNEKRKNGYIILMIVFFSWNKGTV